MDTCKNTEFMIPFIIKFNNIERRVATFTSVLFYLPCPLNRRLSESPILVRTF